MKNSQIYRGFRFPPELISHVVWLYFRFSLSFRDIEELMVSRGIIVSKRSTNSSLFSQAYCRSERYSMQVITRMVASFTTQTEFPLRPGAYRAPQDLPVARLAGRTGPAYSPKPSAEDCARRRPGATERSCQIRGRAALRHTGSTGHRRHGHRDGRTGRSA